MADPLFGGRSTEVTHDHLFARLRPRDEAAERFGFRLGHRLAGQDGIERVGQVVLGDVLAWFPEGRIEVVDAAAIPDGAARVHDNGCGVIVARARSASAREPSIVAVTPV